MECDSHFTQDDDTDDNTEKSLLNNTHFAEADLLEHFRPVSTRNDVQLENKSTKNVQSNRPNKSSTESPRLKRIQHGP